MEEKDVEIWCIDESTRVYREDASHALNINYKL